MTTITHQHVIDVRFHEADGEDPAIYLATNDALGLVCEADTLDALAERVLPLACELFVENVLPTLDAEERAVPSAFMLNGLGTHGGQALS